MLDVIICANFGVEKLRGLGNTRGQILEFPIEMAGHHYNRAGATAQPVMSSILFKNFSFWKADWHSDIVLSYANNVQRKLPIFFCFKSAICQVVLCLFMIVQ